MPEGTNLLIAVPTMGSIHPLLVSRLLYWARSFPPEQVHFYFTQHIAPVDRARNQIVEFFLAQRTPDGRPFTHLLMIDSDTIPPQDAIERLLSHRQDIVSALTPIISYRDHGYETYDNCFVDLERDPDTGKVLKTHIAERGTGLQEIFRCGASCILISRHVFELMKPPYYSFVMNEENTNVVRSEDISFCDQAKERGLAIYADTDVVCTHQKGIMLS